MKNEKELEGFTSIDQKIDQTEEVHDTIEQVVEYNENQKGESTVDLHLTEDGQFQEPNPLEMALYDVQASVRDAHNTSKLKMYYDNNIKDEFLAGVKGSRDVMVLNHVNRNKWDETQNPDVIGKDKHNPITGLSGSIAFRNNNPGALKLEYKGAKLGKTVTQNGRSREQALNKAKEIYDGVVTLDRAGFIVFDNKDFGTAAQNTLMMRRFKKDTIKSMLPKYAVKDDSGDTHHWNYYKAIVSYGDSKGVNLRNREIGSFDKDEMKALTFAMSKVEGV